MNSIRYLKSIENNIPLRIPEKSELISLLFSDFLFFWWKNQRKSSRFYDHNHYKQFLEYKEKNLVLNLFIMKMEYFLFGLIMVFVSVGGLLLFKKLHVLDKPWSDLKNTRKPVPTLQGVFVILGLIIGVGVLYPEYFSSRLFLWLLIPGLLIGVVELIEELSYLGRFPKIPPFVRLIVHFVSAFLAVWIGGIGNQELILWAEVYQIPNWIFTIGFMIWTMFCINAINRFDGIYAQGSWVSAIGFLTVFLLIKYIVFQSYTEFPNLEMLTMVQNLAFFLFVTSMIYAVIEFKPLGLVRDVGIMFFGFALAYLAVAGGAKIWTLIVALSLPIFDAIWVGLYRIFILRKNPLKGDYTHFHHRLLGLWMTRGETRAFIRIWSLMMMVLMLLQWANRFSKVVIFVMMAMLFFGVNWYLFIYKKLPCGLSIQKER